MPKEGKYTIVRISRTLFLISVLETYESGKLVNRLCSEESAQLLRRLTGLPISTNPGKPEIANGDRLLCMARKCEPSDDTREEGSEDYSYSIAFYRSFDPGLLQVLGEDG